MTNRAQRRQQQKAEKRARGPEVASIVTRRGFDLNTDAAGTVVQIQIRASDLPPPDRSLAANWVDAQADGTTISMIFGQMHPLGRRLSAALVVSIPYDRVHEVVAGDDKTWVQQLYEYGQNMGFRAAQREIPDGFPDDRIVFEHASVMALSFMGNDADVRFYRLSPSDIQTLKTRQNAQIVYPVVEVYLSTETLFALITRLRAITDQHGAPVQA